MTGAKGKGIMGNRGNRAEQTGRDTAWLVCVAYLTARGLVWYGSQKAGDLCQR